MWEGVELSGGKLNLHKCVPRGLQIAGMSCMMVLTGKSNSKHYNIKLTMRLMSRMRTPRILYSNYFKMCFYYV